MAFQINLTFPKQVVHHRKILMQVSLSACRHLCDNSSTKRDTLQKIRNIGILAHIDAGKTTTTERMLYFSGKISSMGEVHHGTTVTDYMEQERNRGITITSASVSLSWRDHQINLIDTPGHIDFTMEVENALNVLDGGVVILDSSAGVEAQTLTVWRQADKKSIPRIVYANKMDRLDASLPLCVDTLNKKLGVEVFVVQLPIRDQKNKFLGIVDLLHLKKYLWIEDSKGIEHLHDLPLEESSDGVLWENAVQSRESLIDTLSNFDDNLAEEIIANDSLANIPASVLSRALRKATIKCEGVPLLCGSSYKNKGIQPLMDAVVRYLPSPVERSNRIFQESFADDLCAHAFKVLHHNHLGPLVFLRLYSGRIIRKDKVFNLRLQVPEKCGNVMVATADDFEEVPSVGAGNIAVISGLNETRAGDLVSHSLNTAQKAYKRLAQIKNISENDAQNLLSVGAAVPDAVFFRSIEAPSQSQQVALEKALEKLKREDPSLSVTFNEETSQIVVGGMGELHLDIIKERLMTDYKLDILLGPIQIAYREALQCREEETIQIKETIGSSNQLVELSLIIEPKLDKKTDILTIYSPDPNVQQKLDSIKSNVKIMQAIRTGVKEGLKYGPKLHCPLMSTSVQIQDIVIGKKTSPPMIASATTQCIRKALENADTVLMEPIMFVEVVLNEENQSSVSGDLSRRRADILSVADRHVNRVIQARVPLAEMLGYAKHLRSLTSGTASFSMEFLEYQSLPNELEMKVIEKETGLSYIS
ncbi:Ribosome-releasing factor 2, mitochondrial [Frankliniella fusca]|uniref:Ribosome-releasing factor 2, mitochondrial n=1 Tax=Frankliniella fusca TaxID=407009 RepID=A0AAE1HST6_9NEOP|nr:Ribosome-releasing factor 2, mitochondrial [Frankliniella fusca]